jgi:hypothetical protein
MSYAQRLRTFLMPRRRLVTLHIARTIADRDLQTAVISRDTQRISRAQDAMTAATSAVLRAEIEGRK